MSKFVSWGRKGFGYLVSAGVLHGPGHHGEELRELYGSTAVCVHFINHVLQLGVCGVLVQTPHHNRQLIRRYTLRVFLTFKRSKLVTKHFPTLQLHT